MPLSEPLLQRWRALPRAFERHLIFTSEGLQLGKTIRAYWHKSELLIEEERVLTLLSIRCGRSVYPDVLHVIRRAAKNWQSGNKTQALMQLALTGVQGVDLERSQRLFAAEWGYNRGVTPAQLLKFAGLRKEDDDDDAEDDDSGDGDDTLGDSDGGNGGYNPDEPRVPAGQPGGGQWTTDGASAAVANAVAVATDAGRQAELSTGEEEKADSDPIGGLILPAAGAAAVVEAMGTETFAALTARAQNLVVSAMATVTAMGNSVTEKAQELYDVVQGAVSDWLEDNGPSADRVIGPMQRFGDNDLVYGPEADGELRFLAQQNGGVLLSNKPNDMTWLEFSLNTLNDAAKSGRQIHFDLRYKWSIGWCRRICQYNNRRGTAIYNG